MMLKNRKLFLVVFFLLTILAVGLTGCAKTVEVVTPIPEATPDYALEESFEQQLEAMEPAAVPVYQQANAAYYEYDYETAKPLFEQVITMAPGFSTAYRRLAYIELYFGNDLDHAIELLRKAMELEPSAYNKTTLALALFFKATPKDYQEAYSLASSAVDELPDDESANIALLLSAAAVNNVGSIRQADENLLRVAPYNPLGHYFAGLLAADDGHWEKAETELLYSQALGMDAETVRYALDGGIARNALLMRFLRWGAVALGIWLAGLTILYLTGSILSRVTLRSLGRMEPGIGASLQPAERTIRSIYRAVIVVLLLYFYISIPFVLLALFLFVGGLFYLFFAIGTIPIQLAAILVFVLFASLFAILRSVFWKQKDVPPGRLLNRTDAPELWALVEEVARKMDTKPVDAIYLNPYTGIAVNEKGSILQTLRGTGKRNLILGMAVLPGLTQGQFSAILAHEYGHFYNRDTAGGHIAYQVYATLTQMALGLARSGAARFYNPVWLFVVNYQKIFLNVTRGASRLQEVLADRFAAMAYGRTNSVDGLRSVVRQSLAFELHANFEIRRSLELNQPISNIYQLPMQEQTKNELEKAYDDAMKRETAPYDTHPALKERIALIERMSIPYAFDQENPAPVLGLFPDAEELQRQMNFDLMKNVKVIRK